MPEPCSPPRKNRPPRRGRFLLFLFLFAGLVTALVVADIKWQWRDYLRRLLEGDDMVVFRAEEWQNTAAVREKLLRRLAGTATGSGLDAPVARRDLALYTLVASVGDEALSGCPREVHRFMEALCTDPGWLEEIVYGLPDGFPAAALPLLATIYHNEKAELRSSPACRRFAVAMASACAQAGLGTSEALAYYRAYAGDAQLPRLNASFAELETWKMSIIASRGLDSRWGNRETLLWFRDNVRLPARSYPAVALRVPTHTRSLFGVNVDSAEFRHIYSDSIEAGMARACDDSGCSTPELRAGYAAGAACANGVPAIVAESGQQAVCMVLHRGEWCGLSEMPSSAQCSWSAWGHAEPDFLRLLARVCHGDSMKVWMESCRRAAMGRYLLSRGNQRQGLILLRSALELQALNYPAWCDYIRAGAPAEERERALQLFADYPAVRAALPAATGKGE